MPEPTRTLCHECDRGGRGNAEDKCACGHRITEPTDHGCFLGTPIVGEPVKPPRLTRSQARYQRYLESDGLFESFRDFLAYDKHAHSHA